MRRYRLEIDNVRSHLRSLWMVIGLQGVIILALWFGWRHFFSREYRPRTPIGWHMNTKLFG